MIILRINLLSRVTADQQVDINYIDNSQPINFVFGIFLVRPQRLRHFFISMIEDATKCMDLIKSVVKFRKHVFRMSVYLKHGRTCTV